MWVEVLLKCYRSVTLKTHLAKKSGHLPTFENKSGQAFSLKNECVQRSLPTFPLFSLIKRENKKLYFK